MKHKLTLSSLLLAGILTLAPTALAVTTWYVNGVSGSDSNDCKSPTTACKTIGHAVALASSGDSIMVAAATYSENLTISKSLKIIGSSAGKTIVDGGGKGTVVSIPNTSTSVILSRLTIQNGSQHSAGGIYNGGMLTINKSTVSGNLASRKCYLIPIPIPHFLCFGGTGGGIYSLGTLTIYNSTVIGNVATPGTACNPFCVTSGFGGGIYNGGTLTISNSTISWNSAYQGGGIFGTAVINNSTISDNSANIGGGINGGATLQNSIVANNTTAGYPRNCYGTMTSHGYNLSSDSTCNFNGPGDMNDTKPMLGSLGNYGGPTPTIPLLAGSPAIDAGNPTGCTDGQGHLLKTDQRGFPRPDKDDASGCDMGAYEWQND